MRRLFAMRTCDELWADDGDGWELRERRNESGGAEEAPDGSVIVASTDRAWLADRGMHEEMARELDEVDIHSVRAQLRREIPHFPLRVRALRTRRHVATADGWHQGSTAFLVSTVLSGHGPLSLVHGPDATPALQLLSQAARTSPPSRVSAADGLPMLWCEGTAGVLLHEAIGHPSEEGVARADWPDWLSVTDRPEGPGMISLTHDDRGERTEERDLTRGATPSCTRRASFREMPLVRMTNLVVVARLHMDEIPEPRIEVRLVREGGYDRLHDEITIDVVFAERVEGGRRIRLAPFMMRRRVAELARSLAGAREGGPASCPVICSREGQRLLVDSFAPEILTLPPGEAL